MGKGQLLLVGFLSLVVISAAPKANAFTSQPDAAAAVTGGAPLADPDDRLENLSGSSGDSGSLRPGTTIGSQGNFRPGAVPGFNGATYDRGSDRGD